MPLVSVVIVLSDTDVKSLSSVIDAYMDQTYSNWQLCLVDVNRERNRRLFAEEVQKRNPLSYKKITEDKGAF